VNISPHYRAGWPNSMRDFGRKFLRAQREWGAVGRGWTGRLSDQSEALGAANENSPPWDGGL